MLVSRPYVSPTLLHFTAIHYQLNIGNFQSTKIVRGFSGAGSVCTAGFKGTLVNQLFNIEVVPPTCTVVNPCDLEKLSWNPYKRTIFRCQNTWFLSVILLFRSVGVQRGQHKIFFSIFLEDGFLVVFHVSWKKSHVGGVLLISPWSP